MCHQRQLNNFLAGLRAGTHHLPGRIERVLLERVPDLLGRIGLEDHVRAHDLRMDVSVRCVHGFGEEASSGDLIKWRPLQLTAGQEGLSRVLTYPGIRCR